MCMEVASSSYHGDSNQCQMFKSAEREVQEALAVQARLAG